MDTEKTKLSINDISGLLEGMMLYKTSRAFADNLCWRENPAQFTPIDNGWATLALLSYDSKDTNLLAHSTTKFMNKFMKNSDSEKTVNSKKERKMCFTPYTAEEVTPSNYVSEENNGVAGLAMAYTHKPVSYDISIFLSEVMYNIDAKSFYKQTQTDDNFQVKQGASLSPGTIALLKATNKNDLVEEIKNEIIHQNVKMLPLTISPLVYLELGLKQQALELAEEKNIQVMKEFKNNKLGGYYGIKNLYDDYADSAIVLSVLESKKIGVLEALTSTILDFERVKCCMGNRMFGKENNPVTVIAKTILASQPDKAKKLLYLE